MRTSCGRRWQEKTKNSTVSPPSGIKVIFSILSNLHSFTLLISAKIQISLQNKNCRYFIDVFFPIFTSDTGLNHCFICCQGIEIVRRKYEDKLRQTLARIEELIVAYEVDEIILGYPKNMNDSLGELLMVTIICQITRLTSGKHREYV